MTEQVHIYEVGPRDGLQNEPGVIPVQGKVALIDALGAAGLPAIEIGSFVSPRRVPQMADTARVMEGISYDFPARLGVLIPNRVGWEAFRAACAPLAQVPDEVAVFISASEGFSRANLNCSIAESVERLAPVAAAALEAGFALRGYISCVTDCPYDGPTPPAAVAHAAELLRAVAPMPLSLGDTIGKGRPETVAAMLRAVMEVAPPEQLAGHFHDTGGKALENVEVALEMGLRTFDGAAGGLGGCPFAPGAPGNLATEALVDRVEALGYVTGVDRAALARAAEMARALRAAARAGAA
ncbi:MAG: hydroxymethylglutaryl-CoA lyase [Limimaricola sp.]|uniref:hydroxymethylglutaryl-CoA lyase n=1 Tax=Limimaricola sp. TaxID=2211665 RepID=UPI001D43B317|nr:hydroxymethylglutaryl-CoA lyase [Limimaricola sp.]MBI1418506.1 hydroxymethylglutaryl-CoA lyase [Limimaricola sp.]